MRYNTVYKICLEEWTDITCIVDSRETVIKYAGCSTELKSIVSTCDTVLKYNESTKAFHAEVVAGLLAAKSNGQTVKFRMTGALDFVGKIDLSTFSQTNTSTPGFISITAEDSSYLLDEIMGEDFEYPDAPLEDEGYHVFNKSDLPHSIVYLRLLDAGYTADDIDIDNSDSIDTKVRRVVYDKDSEKTYRELLDLLLYEHCAVLHTTLQGKLTVKRLYVENPVASRELDFTIKDGISTKGGNYNHDGIKVIWSTLGILENATVYNANLSLARDEQGNLIGEEIQPKHYWPETGDIEDVWQEFGATFLDRPYQTKESRLQNKDLSIISVKNLKAQVIKDNAVILANNPPDIKPTKARYVFYNSSTDVKNLKAFTLEGTALYRNKLSEYTFPPDAKKLDKDYETTYVFDEDTARTLANHLLKFRKYGDLSHVWSENRRSDDLFSIVNIAAPDTLISTLGLIITQEMRFLNPEVIKSTYTALGITPFNSEPVKSRSVMLSGRAINTGPKGESGTRAVVQFSLGDKDGPYDAVKNVVGVVDTVVGDKSNLLGIDRGGWQFTAPIPDIGEIVWRREGYYTPPEEWPGAWSITPISGADRLGIEVT
ncbi:MAG TPA: hypothetical protein PLY43_04150, partial [Ruminococcus sp.]|nr:hypothetical protein [Ruminococcus sp.]